MKPFKRQVFKVLCVGGLVLFTSVVSPSAVNSRYWWLGFFWQVGAGCAVGIVSVSTLNMASRSLRLQSMLSDRGYQVPLSVLANVKNWKEVEEKIEVYEVDPQAFGSLTEFLEKEVGR